MTCRFHIPADQHDIYKSLPDDACRDVAYCLRALARVRAAVVILIGEQTSTITVLAITYAG
ncbi:hypothetical protein [Streptomyces sp. 1222.5]|uniref:hypothetical protein n=1 Tax=Streptomyces sp. 1222.5 TaxID=1881026 RepID=UPI003D7501D5